MAELVVEASFFPCKEKELETDSQDIGKSQFLILLPILLRSNKFF